MPDPAALAARLAEIRANHADVAAPLTCCLCDVFAAYGALAEAVLEHKRALNAAPNRDITPAESAALYAMLVLAWAGRGGS